MEGAPLKGTIYCQKNPVQDTSLMKIRNFMCEYRDYGVALVLAIVDGIPENDLALLLEAYPIKNNPDLLKRLEQAIIESPDSMRILSGLKKSAPDIWQEVINLMDSPEAGEESTILGDYGF